MQTPCLFPLALLLALGIGPASAETFYNKDGVQLSATARVIDPGGATCRIREERHSAEEYARLQPNHGQPLDVWRVELVVANYSGKVLDYLSAHLNVESAWPPCDNWDGLGNYGKQVVWTGPLMTIHVVSSVEPGEERREIAFVLAWHEAEPVLGRWAIDYDFAAGAAGSETAQKTATVAPETARTGGFQPDETCADKEIPDYFQVLIGNAAYPACWREVENYPRCYFWVQGASSSEATATWTGECSDGLANGSGTLNYRSGFELTGQLQNGKMNGH